LGNSEDAAEDEDVIDAADVVDRAELPDAVALIELAEVGLGVGDALEVRVVLSVVVDGWAAVVVVGGRDDDCCDVALVGVADPVVVETGFVTLRPSTKTVAACEVLEAYAQMPVSPDDVILPADASWYVIWVVGAFVPWGQARALMSTMEVPEVVSSRVNIEFALMT